MSRKFLCVDTETYEENIKKWGAGYYINRGHIIGISFADDTGWSTYLPLAHPETTEQERRKNIAVAKEIFEEPCLHIAHNSLYDNVYLCGELGFKIPDYWHDTQYTMSLLDEYRGRYGGPGYSLDAVATDLIGQKKEKDYISEYCEQRGWEGDPRQHLWRMPASIVDSYARKDVTLLPSLYKVQMEHIHKEELDHVYDIETGLLPVLIQMNRNGIQIDNKKRVEVSDKLTEEADRLQIELYKEFGRCNYNSTKQLAILLDQMQIEYEMTTKGNPSITNDFLDSLAKQGHIFAHKLVQWRKITKARDTFINGAFVDFQDSEARIHSTLLPVAIDEGGTVSGRFASKNPNLQQVPSKNGSEDLGDYPLGTMCRDIFVAKEGTWKASADYSQLELRMILHYALAPNKDQMKTRYSSLLYSGIPEEKAYKITQEEYKKSKQVLEEMLDTFNRIPDTDVHSLVADITELPRKEAKSVTFGVAFYEGKQKLMKKNGWTEEKADYVLATYFDNLPFIKPSRDIVVKTAETRGYIRTISGRKARLAPYMLEGAKRDRKTYRMYNRLPQGSGADACKKAIVDAYRGGVFNIYNIQLQVHDEVLGEIPQTKEGIDAFKEMHYYMENSYKLRLPLTAEPSIGVSWGSTEDRQKKEDGTKESLKEFWNRYYSLCN